MCSVEMKWPLSPFAISQEVFISACLTNASELPNKMFEQEELILSGQFLSLRWNQISLDLLDFILCAFWWGLVTWNASIDLISALFLGCSCGTSCHHLWWPFQNGLDQLPTVLSVHDTHSVLTVFGVRWARAAQNFAATFCIHILHSKFDGKIPRTHKSNQQVCKLFGNSPPRSAQEFSWCFYLLGGQWSLWMRLVFKHQMTLLNRWNPS